MPLPGGVSFLASQKYVDLSVNRPFDSQQMCSQLFWLSPFSHFAGLELHAFKVWFGHATFLANEMWSDVTG